MNGYNNIQNEKESVRDLRKICKKAIKKISNKLKKQMEEYKKYSNWLWYKQIGDSILVKSTKISKGNTSCIITNVHSGRKEEISLNPKLNAAQNAEKYFRKSKKGKRGLDICSDQLKKTEDMLEKVNILAEKCSDTLDMDDNTEEFKQSVIIIQSEMEELDLTKISRTGNKADKIKVPYRHLTIEGWDIFVGKNDTQNDELSIKFAKPWDIWFHVAVHAGSHVVLRREKNSCWPPKQIIEIVASITAWFSKARHTSYTEVTVAEARYVTKRRKSPPGQVMVERYKTVRVTPRSPQEFFKNDALK